MINFLPKPEINLSKLKYIAGKNKVYANLYEIKLLKDLKLCQYPFQVTPEIEAGDLRIRGKIFKTCKNLLKATYGECFISGDSIYAENKIDESKSVNANIYLKGITEYTLNIQKCAKVKTIKEEDIQKDQLAKQFIEMLIHEILKSNPKIEFFKGLFVRSDQQQLIETENVSIKFYPGFTTSFMETEGGNFLNITLKNKIIQTENILDYLKEHKYKIKENQDIIKYQLIGRSFKVGYAKRNYKIDDVLFDRNPKNQKFNHDGQTKTLIEYYIDSHGIKIKDETQPLILVKKKGPQDKMKNLFFIPELCSLTGLEDESIKDGMFMRELSKYTKLEPTARISKTNEFLQLLSDPTKDPNNKDALSAKEKSELFGIEVKPIDKLFDGYYMEDTRLIAENNKSIKSNDRQFPVKERVDMTSWLCFYEKCNYSDAENLYNNLSKAAKSFKIQINEPEWVEMPNKSKPKEWTDAADEYIGNGKDDYKFVIFLLGKNDHLYTVLKKHSLVKNGYVSQVVKTNTLRKRGVMSVCSKILLQINSKLRGVSYEAKFGKEILDRKIMVIGVDSSRVIGKRTGVAMVASINNTFNDFFNKEEIIKEEEKDELNRCVSSFIEEACSAYLKENGYLPNNIIIYRQGVSLHQKEFLKTEMKQVEEVCATKKIKFYYILVNTKTTYKFFEKGKNGQYYNPGAGLLIMGGITNRNFFEFYIQPQEVTIGSATPTCFHVAYGDMGFPEIIPKFTYDLCHLYSNWQGTVRIPNVIKCAEKLSKMTAKYTVGELNEDLKLGQGYL